MPRATPKARPLTLEEARRLWLGAQRLDVPAPFGAGPAATRAAVEHLGYVQIDTINVIERSHHHILWSRIPGYRRADLATALSVEKSVFEYWTHALAYIPTRDYRFFMTDMKEQRAAPNRWYAPVAPKDLRGVVGRIRRDGPLSIRDIDDDVLVEKDHPWASRKPSKRALQLAFYRGDLTVSARAGMVKTYELTDRHFGWPPRPRPATERQVLDYLLDRATGALGLVSLDAIPQLDRARKAAMAALIAARVRRRALVPVTVEGLEKQALFMPADAEIPPGPDPATVHLLSPFDPLVILRRRLEALFGFEYRFEAYVPKAKRKLGYFALPILAGDRIVAAIDIKCDRAARALAIQQWTWIGDAGPGLKPAIEAALDRFERFQFGD
jgi:uncharacterized protein YcaQ